MPLNDQDNRPITFQGVTFPATLMGITVLESILDFKDEDLGSWLWRLTICCGVTKGAPAERCARCARRAADLMLEHRQRVLAGIQEYLVPHGFDVETTYRDWMMALQRIVELSEATDGDCSWSAPSHPNDNRMTQAEFLARLDRARADSMKKSYFVRCARFDTIGEEVVLMDLKNPRMITLDRRLEVIYAAADGQITLQQFIERLKTQYPGGAPAGLEQQTLDLITELQIEKLIRLDEQPAQLPYYLSMPVSQQDKERALAEMKRDGYIK